MGYVFLLNSLFLFATARVSVRGAETLDEKGKVGACPLFLLSATYMGWTILSPQLVNRARCVEPKRVWHVVSKSAKLRECKKQKKKNETVQRRMV